MQGLNDAGSEYPIERWDVIIGNDASVKYPLIYIKPDSKFIEFVKNVNGAVVAEIGETGLAYDTNKVLGTVSTSEVVPNFRPNFFKKTGYYVIQLQSPWYGYPHPDTLGNVRIYGLDNSSETGYSSLEMNFVDNYVSKRNLFCFMCIFVIVYTFYYLKSN